MWFLSTYSWDKRFCIHNSGGTLLHGWGLVFIAHQWAGSYGQVEWIYMVLWMSENLGLWTRRTAWVVVVFRTRNITWGLCGLFSGNVNASPIADICSWDNFLYEDLIYWGSKLGVSCLYHWKVVTIFFWVSSFRACKMIIFIGLWGKLSR